MISDYKRETENYFPGSNSTNSLYRDFKVFYDSLKLRNVGGIDLNPNMLDLQTQGEGIDFDIPIDPQVIQTIQIDGFSPVIFQIVPTNLPLLFGTKTNQPEQQQLTSMQ